MNDYDKVIADLQELIDDKPPTVYIALPLSDISSMRSLPSNSEVHIPDVLSGSWYWAGDLLKCIRAIGRGQELETIHATDWNKQDCPECLGNHTCEVKMPAGYAVHYCIDCGLQWQYYMAWCPSCGGFLHGDDDEVKCDKCNQTWSTELAKSANETGDLMVEL